MQALNRDANLGRFKCGDTHRPPRGTVIKLVVRGTGKFSRNRVCPTGSGYNAASIEYHAPVVQLDRASAFEAESCRFESYRVRQLFE